MYWTSRTSMVEFVRLSLFPSATVPLERQPKYPVLVLALPTRFYFFGEVLAYRARTHQAGERSGAQILFVHERGAR